VTLVSVEQVGEVSRRFEALCFQAHPIQVSACRHSVLEKLRAWRTPVRLEDVELLVSEIVTNAILHGAPLNNAEAYVVVELEETAEGLLVRVRDSGSEWKPKAADPADLMESGRGLLLVGKLAESWGHQIEQGSTFVYFVVRYLDAGSGEPFAAEEHSGAESGACLDDPHEMSRPCDMPTIPARRRSSRDARSTRRTRSSLAISTLAMGSARAAICCRAQSHSPAPRSNVFTRASWTSSLLPWPTPLYFAESPYGSRVRSHGIGAAAWGCLVVCGRAPASTRAPAICMPPSNCLGRALYWGGRECIGLGARIRRPMNSRDQQDHRTHVESTGSRT
jgi:anti-sigma regulatory factor (Ser/Thr protein kinase)